MCACLLCYLSVRLCGVCLCVCVLACLLSRSLACFLACWLAGWFACLLACLLLCLFACFFAFLVVCLFVCLCLRLALSICLCIGWLLACLLARCFVLLQARRFDACCVCSGCQQAMCVTHTMYGIYIYIHSYTECYVCVTQRVSSMNPKPGHEHAI